MTGVHLRPLLKTRSDGEAVVRFVTLLRECAEQGVTAERAGEIVSAVHNKAIADVLLFLQHEGELATIR